MSITDATVIKDFYSIELPDRSTSDVFERAFSEIEDVASSALRLVVQGRWPLPEEAKQNLALWIALQHLRSEEIRASQTDMNGMMIRILVGVSGKEALRSHIERAEGRPVEDQELDEEWRDLTKPGGPDLEPDVTGHLRLALQLWPRMAAHLADSHWTLIRFTKRALVTSDHPVSMAVDENYPEHMGVGIATADLFTVPLTRRLGLNIQPRIALRQYTDDVDGVRDFVVTGTTAFANSMNQQTVNQARRYVYHHPDDELSGRIHLPAPVDRSRMDTSTGDNMIREEGLFADADNRAVAEALSPFPGRDGFSLSDLPWPIPRRRPRRS